MNAMGLDVGSVAAKGALLAGKKCCKALLPTGWSPRDTAEKLMHTLLKYSGLYQADLHQVVVTGYGRVALQKYFRTVTEISCHARGISELYNGENPLTVIDIGGQDSKVIQVGAQGKVLNFAMNDKCAAGTGRFLEVMATALGMDVGDLGIKEDLSSRASINSMCTVFAESEVIGLLAGGAGKEGIIAGIHHSVARRVAVMARRLGVQGKVVLTGGVALNAGVHRALQEELSCPVLVPRDCQFTGALGAALLASGS